MAKTVLYGNSDFIRTRLMILCMSGDRIQIDTTCIWLGFLQQYEPHPRLLAHLDNR